MDITKALEDLRGLIQTRDAEVAELGKAREETAKKLDKAGEDMIALKAEIAEKEKSHAAEIADLRKLKEGGASKRTLSVGEQFTKSDAFVAAVKAGSVEIPKVQLSGGMFKKDTNFEPVVSGADSGGVLVERDSIQMIVEQIWKAVTIKSLVGYGTTTSDKIPYLSEEFDNKAAFHDNKTLEEVDGEDVLEKKKRSGIKFTEKIVNTKTVAHYLTVGRDIMRDAPQLAARINANGISGLEDKINSQMLSGVEGSASFNGILNTDGIANDTVFPDVVSNTLDRIRISIARNATLGYPTTGIVLEPVSFAEMQLIKGSDNHYIWIEAGQGMASTIWRVRVAEDAAMTAGKYLLGDFAGSAMLWDRMLASVRMTESHKDQFVRNMTTVLIEASLAFEVTRPAAFRTGDFAAVSTT
ncbi:MAG: phage major capsid protein [Sulfurimonas sp.]|uniref:phage major capsid protein n=1 Tax=Sulfurimonas sp. TaxID=2022749 RepID=UPI0025F302F0|nr:phage major capsid protein [Sulfurimonas sp.]MCK9492681.1 phage major capsid protein [Sulfurimonas sp.]